ncbi:MAG: CbiX/SirB N-terminal domain-containing protein [Casimicrobiaceae bacterium]
MTDAIVLFAHGSRDSRWAAPFQAIRDRVTAAAGGRPVRLAFLEMMSPGLVEAIAEIAATGARAVLVVPLFLGQGGHLREDLPRLVREAEARHPGVAIRLAGAAGEAPGVLDALSAYCVAVATDANPGD